MKLRAALALAFALSVPVAACAQDQPKWMKAEAARAESLQTGKAIVFYTGAAFPEPKDFDNGKADGSITDKEVKKQHGNYLWVKVFDKKTQEQIKATSRGEVIIVDPEGNELARKVLAGAPDMLAALKEADQKYGPKQIAWLPCDEKALADAKEAKKLVVLAFADDGKDSGPTLKALEDRAVSRFHEQCVFLKSEYQKDSEEAKRWGVTVAPSVLFVDPSKEAGAKAVVEKLSGKREPSHFKTAFTKALKALARK